MPEHLDITVSGDVQDVSFRSHTQHEAELLGLTGFVRNESDGTVYIEAEGEPQALQQLIHWCKNGPDRARVDQVKTTSSPLKHFKDFNIQRS